MSALIEARWRERHELGALQQLVEPIVDGRIARLIEDAAIAEGARPVLHLARETRHDTALRKLLGDFRFDTARRMLEAQTFARQGRGDLALVVSVAEINVLELVWRILTLGPAAPSTLVSQCGAN